MCIHDVVSVCLDPSIVAQSLLGSISNAASWRASPIADAVKRACVEWMSDAIWPMLEVVCAALLGLMLSAESPKLPAGLEMEVNMIGLPTKDDGRDRRLRIPMVVVRKTLDVGRSFNKGARAAFMHSQTCASNASCLVGCDEEELWPLDP